MSYVDNLYTNYSYVLDATDQSKKTLSDLIKFFKARVDIEESHMRGYEKLANFNLRIREGTILNAINAMKNDYYSRAFQTKTLIDFISSDIITVLQNLQTSQQEVMKPVIAEASKIQKTKETLVEALKRLKTKYWRSCEECGKLTSSLEELNNQSSREKLLSKLVTEKQALDTNLKAYHLCLNQYSSFTENYKDSMTSALNHHELQEKERLETSKDSLRKLVVYDTSFIRNVEYDLNSLAKFVEGINTNSDFRMIIDDCNTSDLTEMVFEQFPSSEPESFASPLKFLRSTPGDPGSVMEKYVTEFEAVFQKLHIDLDPEDFTIFNSLVKDSIGRLAWVKVLQGKPAKIRTKAFDQLGELTISLLNECERNKDSVVLAECLKFVKHFKSRKGDYLTKLVSFHSIWGQLQMWEEVIDVMIKNEIENREVHKIFEDEPGKKAIVKNIAFCQLGAVAEFMKLFKVEVIYANEIIAKNACKHELNNDDIDILIATIDPSQVVSKPKTTVQEGIPSWLKEITPPPKRGIRSLDLIFQNQDTH
jgi:hypothetical protein